MDDFSDKQYEDIRLHMKEYFREKADCDDIIDGLNSKVDRISDMELRHDKDISNIMLILKIMGILVASYMGTGVIEKIVSLF